MTCRPGHPARHPDFTVGNELAVRHGAYSARVVGQRAQLVRVDVRTSRPDLSDDPDSALPVELFCRAVAREELAHEGLERAVAAGKPISPRLLEVASAAARVAAELGDRLGIGPLAAAQLHKVQAQTAVSLSLLAQQAPRVLAAIGQALEAVGLAEHREAVFQALAEALVEVEDGD